MSTVAHVPTKPPWAAEPAKTAQKPTAMDTREQLNLDEEEMLALGYSVIDLLIERLGNLPSALPAQRATRAYTEAL